MAESALADRDCIAWTGDHDPFRGDDREPFEEIDQEVWEIVDDPHLEGTYEFGDFRDALEFTTEVGELAEEERHHPTIHLSGGAVVIEIWTQTIDGLFETDFIMAARRDRIHEAYAPD